MTWTKAQKDILKGFCATSISMSQIACEINAQTRSSFTRNACIGMAMREGWLKDKPKKVFVQRAHPVRRKGHDGGIAYRVQSGRGRKPSKPDLFASIPLPVEALNIPFFDLERAHCRFPTSGEGHLTLFCGNESVKGHPYCGFHCHMAYEPARPRAAPYHYYNAA